MLRGRPVLFINKIPFRIDFLFSVLCRPWNVLVGNKESQHTYSSMCAWPHQMPSLCDQTRVNSLRMAGPRSGFGGIFRFILEVVYHLASPCCYFYLKRSRQSNLIKLLILVLSLNEAFYGGKKKKSEAILSFTTIH